MEMNGKPVHSLRSLAAILRRQIELPNELQNEWEHAWTDKESARLRAQKSYLKPGDVLTFGQSDKKMSHGSAKRNEASCLKLLHMLPVSYFICFFL